MSGEPELERAIARARRIQAATSLTAAVDMAMQPTSRTGKAVMERPMPMKTRKGPWWAPSTMVCRRTTEVPRTKGRVMPAMAIAKAQFAEETWAKLKDAEKVAFDEAEK